jgi:integrase
VATIEKYQLSSGATLYRVRHRVDGRSTQKRGFRTRREAEQYLAQVEVAKGRGEYVSPTVGRVTIGELGPAWLQRQRGHLKPSSIAAYESAWSNQESPRWGHVRVGDVRFSTVQAWVSELSTRLGAESVKVAYQIQSRVLDDAVADRMLASNPARGVKRPRPQPKRKPYLEAQQISMLAEEAGEYGGLVLLLGIGGLRWGEAIALRVCDIDFLRRRVNLHRNVTQVRGKMIEGSLKNNKNRVVVLPSFVVEAMAVTAEGRGREDLLWPNPSGTYQHPPREGGWLSKRWRAASMQTRPSHASPPTT